MFYWLFSFLFFSIFVLNLSRFLFRRVSVSIKKTWYCLDKHGDGKGKERKKKVYKRMISYAEKKKKNRVGEMMKLYVGRIIGPPVGEKRSRSFFLLCSGPLEVARSHRSLSMIFPVPHYHLFSQSLFLTIFKKISVYRVFFFFLLPSFTPSPLPHQ